MEKSLFKNYTKYTGLNILGMLGLSCYILADTYFVSKALGTAGIAGLNLSIPIYSIVHGLGLMIGIGAATRFSILKAKGNSDQAQIVFSTALKAGILLGLILTLIGILAPQQLASILGADLETLPLTATYLGTILIFAPFFIINNVVLAFVRNDGNPNLAMLAMLAGSFGNIVLDYVFMFPLNMGMFGAAFATCLAPLISIVVLLFHFVRKENPTAILQNKLVWRILPDLFSLGLSACIMEIASAVVLITFNLVILSLEGNLGVAAYGIVANLALVATGIFTGLAQGTQPLASKYHGAQDKARVDKVRKYAFSTAIVLAIAIYLGVSVYARSIVSIFNSEGSLKVAQLAEEGLRIYFLGFFFVGLNIVAAGYLSATENAKDAFLVSILRGFVLIVPLVLVLSRLWSMTGVWLAFVFTELMVTLLVFYLQRDTTASRSIVST